MTDPYDGAPHPDRSRPEDHDDVPPIVWAEWQTERARQAREDAIVAGLGFIAFFLLYAWIAWRALS